MDGQSCPDLPHGDDSRAALAHGDTDRLPQGAVSGQVLQDYVLRRGAELAPVPGEHGDEPDACHIPSPVGAAGRRARLTRLAAAQRVMVARSVAALAHSSPSARTLAMTCSAA